MKNILDSVTENIGNRLKNPFAGAFIVSWLIYNWKEVTILLFGDNTFQVRIENFKSADPNWIWIISEEALIQNSLWILKFIAAPSIMAISFILLAPWISYIIENFSFKIDKKRVNAKIDHDTVIEENKEKLVRARARANKQEIFVAEELNSELEKIKLDRDIAAANAKREAAEIEEEIKRNELLTVKQKSETELLREQEEKLKLDNDSQRIENEKIELENYSQRLENEKIELENEKSKKVLKKLNTKILFHKQNITPNATTSLILTILQKIEEGNINIKSSNMINILESSIGLNKKTYNKGDNLTWKKVEESKYFLTTNIESSIKTNTDTKFKHRDFIEKIFIHAISDFFGTEAHSIDSLTLLLKKNLEENLTIGIGIQKKKRDSDNPNITINNNETETKKKPNIRNIIEENEIITTLYGLPKNEQEEKAIIKEIVILETKAQNEKLAIIYNITYLIIGIGLFKSPAIIEIPIIYGTNILGEAKIIETTSIALKHTTKDNKS